MQKVKRVALVTGAAGAIGSAVVKRLEDSGFLLASADVGKVSKISRKGIAIELDVRSADGVRNAVRKTLDKFGRLDVLVNVAGITSLGSAQELAEEEWQSVLDINLTGSFRCAQAVIPTMKSQGFGRIVNLGSVLGKNGGNTRPWVDASEQQNSGNIAYGVSKAGVHAMTAYLAREVASFGITVNAVAPGPVASAMTASLPPAIKAMIPVGRMGMPDDVAAMISFLVSDEASFITGEVIDVNGGMWCD